MYVCKKKYAIVCKKDQQFQLRIWFSLRLILVIKDSHELAHYLVIAVLLFRKYKIDCNERENIYSEMILSSRTLDIDTNVFDLVSCNKGVFRYDCKLNRIGHNFLPWTIICYFFDPSRYPYSRICVFHKEKIIRTYYSLLLTVRLIMIF